MRSRIVVLGSGDTLDLVGLYASARALGEDATIWLAPDGDLGLLALGSAWHVAAAGPGRFAEVARAWDEQVDGALIDGPRDARATGPVLLGGFGFSDQAAVSSVWRRFETATLVLPRLLVTAADGQAWLTTTAVARDDDYAAATTLWDQVLEGAAVRRPDAPRPIPQMVREVPERAEWRTVVSRLAGAVGRGRLDKVVLARRLDLATTVDIDVPALIDVLLASAIDSTVFAISHGPRTFLGATPERLVSAEGRSFRTVAMAGSAGRGTDPADDDRLATVLLASEKEREEHRVVVEMLRETLKPLATRLDLPARPSVRRLPHVQHLVTEIEGELREASGVLALVERLHPTPAVGGTPRDLALELIVEQERIERGWYAGPVGWVDRHGDGEFVVGIRSAVIEGSHASLFAGCGIVADSDPAREWQESVDKLRALGSALGMAGA